MYVPSSSSPFQEGVRYFAMNMLLFQRPSITDQNMRVNILEVGVLTKPEELIMNEVILNNI